ncbi:response regulator [Candidatus Woesearchaeota archaeon]|nr:response regulator [Candidatus Woesearchaeota archaeon]
MIRILVVDDSAFIRKMLTSTLTKFGVHKIDEASDGYEAIQLARTNNYNLIFMDIMMPKMDGIQSIKNIIMFNPEAKIVVCTSAGQEQVVSESVKAGAKDVITKPFEPELIKKILQKYLGQDNNKGI